MSLPVELPTHPNVRCACTIYLFLKITDPKPSDIICLAILVMNYVEIFENVCLSKPRNINKSLEQLELHDRFNKNVHLIFPCIMQNPSVFLCSKTYHKANKYTHIKIRTCFLKKSS